MNNVGPSKNFSKNAINFYKQVANYVDAGKIEKNVEEWHEFSQILEIELYVMMGFCGLLLICVIFRCLYYYCHWEWQDNDQDPQPLPDVGNAGRFQCYVIIFVFLLFALSSLYLSWLFGVSIPIKNEVGNVKKWNNKINGTKSDDSDDFKNINVIDKVNGEDKENFKSTDNFISHYEKESNTAFGSYFYYFYFIELSQNKTKDEQSTVLDKDNNKIVKDDYKQFNDTKDECGISDRIVGRIIIAIISAVVIVAAIVLLIINIILTCRLASQWRVYLNQLENFDGFVPAGDGAGGNVNHVGGDEGNHNANVVDPNANPVAGDRPPQQGNVAPNDHNAINPDDQDEIFVPPIVIPVVVPPVHGPNP